MCEVGKLGVVRGHGFNEAGLQTILRRLVRLACRESTAPDPSTRVPPRYFGHAPRWVGTDREVGRGGRAVRGVVWEVSITGQENWPYRMRKLSEDAISPL